MICGKCLNKPMARGIKNIECVVCLKQSMVNVKHTNVCFDCSNEHNICQSCGENYSIIVPSDDQELITKLRYDGIEHVDISKQGE